MSLQVYIARRLLFFIPMLVGITLMSFVLSHAVPANPVTANLGEQAAANPEVVAAFRHEWGLDRPLYEQYGIYLWNLAHGDLGISISTRQPVALDIRQRFPATIELSIAAMIISLTLGIPLGIISAVKRDTALDQVARLISLIGVSTPVFWLGLLALLVFYAHLGWAPSPGLLDPNIISPPFITGFTPIDALLAGRPAVAVNFLQHLILPAFALSFYTLGVVTRMMRGSMLEVLGEDYVRTARSKGLGERIVIVRHAARNGLIPVITVIGLSFGGLLSGAVIIETVFAWPGLGLYAFKSATSLDFPAIMGASIVIATVYIFVNLLVDIAYAFADPRIRVS